MFEIILLFVFAILATIVYRLLYRYGIKNSSVYVYTVLNHIFSSIFTLPLAYIYFSFDTSIEAISVLGCGVFFWTIAAMIGSFSIFKSDTSLREPISQTKTIFGFMLGIILFNESIYPIKILGAIIIFIGGIVTCYKKDATWSSIKEDGVFLILFSSILTVIANTFDKMSTNYYNIFVYSFFIYFIPLIIFLFFIPKRIKEFHTVNRKTLVTSFLGSLFQVLSVYTVLLIFKKTEFSVAYPILQTASIFTVLGGIFILKERKNLGNRILGIVIAVIGVLFIKLGK